MRVKQREREKQRKREAEKERENQRERSRERKEEREKKREREEEEREAEREREKQREREKRREREAERGRVATPLGRIIRLDADDSQSFGDGEDSVGVGHACHDTREGAACQGQTSGNRKSAYQRHPKATQSAIYRK